MSCFDRSLGLCLGWDGGGGGGRGRGRGSRVWGGFLQGKGVNEGGQRKRVKFISYG